MKKRGKATRRSTRSSVLLVVSVLAVAATACTGSDGTTSETTEEATSVFDDLDALFEAQMESTPELVRDPEAYAGTELDGPDMADEREELAQLAERASTGDEEARAEFARARDEYPEFFSLVIERIKQQAENDGAGG